MGGDVEGRIFLNTTVFDGFKLRSVKSILVNHEGSIELDPPAAFNSKLALKAKKIDGQNKIRADNFLGPKKNSGLVYSP